ncbi:TMEM165/GDT1 family protein [Limnofasciculus baicalensis]|uniref:GDT1 family protein n=1 Tax=Limnofasciculus baicalensis BBK-W-15 TaxID=2699891 RepID=A0AAE3GTA2_9CYAN|nr:TMEM165/GDT1 family protein [Limnofasciculus baicalensis]MCP2729503.1 TMEM165/GDT1 family protein [Limnofasciculus baicalensis BBK-W-15]
MIPSSPSSVDSLPTTEETATPGGAENSSTPCDGNNPTESENPSLVTEDSQSIGQKQHGIWSIFSSTFITIFLAEMGDKTQLSTLLIAAESQSPWIVFAGAAIALIATSLLGVLVGYWLSNRLSPKTMERSAGILLLFISVMLLWDVVLMGA